VIGLDQAQVIDPRAGATRRWNVARLCGLLKTRLAGVGLSPGLEYRHRASTVPSVATRATRASCGLTSRTVVLSSSSLRTEADRAQDPRNGVAKDYPMGCGYPLRGRVTTYVTDVLLLNDSRH
jgi:hypothetical protein